MYPMHYQFSRGTLKPVSMYWGTNLTLDLTYPARL